MNDQIIKALQWRYATKGFDPTKKVSKEDLHTILEAGRLAPSSFGVESWKFIVVADMETREKLSAVGYSQPQITNASCVIVTAYRTDGENMGSELVERMVKTQGVEAATLDGLRQMVDGSVAMKKKEGTLNEWLRAQAYIPLGVMVTTAALMGIDACPMEGFSADGVDEVLGLKAKNLRSTTFLALGYRMADDPAAKRLKVRRTFDDVVELR